MDMPQSGVKTLPSLQDQGRLSDLAVGAGSADTMKVLLNDERANEAIMGRLEERLDANGKPVLVQTIPGIAPELWSLISNSFKLTFLTEKDAAILSHEFEEAVCDVILTRPQGAFTMDTMVNIDQGRMLFHANIRRSVGTITSTSMNERIAQFSSNQNQYATFREVTKPNFNIPILGKLLGGGR